MIAVKANELRDNFKNICELVSEGETVIIPRPHNQNVVFLSEKEFNLREKAFRNAEYLKMIDKSMEELEEGKTVTFTIDELELMENMTAEEAQAFVSDVRKGQGK